MRASETTFRNLKRLHLVFAVSSLALLTVTVWMLAADHWREWKVYQRTFRDRIEPWLTEARIREEQTDEYAAREEALAAELSNTRSGVPEREPVEQFCEELKREASRRGSGQAGLTGIEEAYQSLVAQPSEEKAAGC